MVNKQRGQSEYQFMNSPKSGMTLLEVLLAMTIFAFLSIAIVKITDTSFKSKEQITSEDNAVSAVERALLRLDWDLSHFYTPLYFTFQKEKNAPGSDNLNNRFEGQNKRYAAETDEGFLIPRIDNPNKNTLQFMSSGNQRKSVDNPESNFSWITYTLRPSEKKIEANTTGSALYELIRYNLTKDLYNFEKIDLDKEKAQVLIDNVLSLEFSFWSNSKAKFLSSLNELDEEEANTLRIILVKLEWMDELGNKNEEKMIVRTLYPTFSRPKKREVINKPTNPNEKKNPSSQDSDQNPDATPTPSSGAGIPGAPGMPGGPISPHPPNNPPSPGQNDANDF